MALPVVGKRYRFRNSKYGTYLDWSTALVHHTPATPAPEFVLFSASRDPARHLLCVSKAGKGAFGAPLGVIAGVRSESSPDYMCDTPAHWGKDTARTQWSLKDDTASGGLRLRNTLTAQYIQAVEDGDTVGFVDDKQTDGTDLWIAEETFSYDEVLNLGHGDSTPLKSPKLKDMNPPPNYEPPEPGQLVAVAAVPFFLIKKDTHKDTDWQAEHSPYYIIKRWSRWRLVKWGTYAAGKSETYTWSTTWGVTTEKSKAISESTHWNITASAGFSFEGFGLSVSGAFGRDLNVTTTTGSTESYTQDYSKSVSLSPPYDQAIGTWCREDRYIVFRADADTDILTFEAIPENSNIELSYLDTGQA